MMKFAATFFSAVLFAVSMAASAGPGEEMFPDTVAMEISSDQTTFKPKNDQISVKSSAILLYDVRGRLMDAGSDKKAIKEVLKSKLPGVCDIYYNPVSPNLDSNAQLILSKNVKLKAFGIPTGIGKPMGTWVKFKTTLSSPSGYFIANFTTTDPKFAGQTIQDDFNVASHIN